MTNHTAAKIVCQNPECQAPNPASHNFCAHCRTAIPKVYLWAVGEDALTLKTGQTLANNRYLAVNNRVLLDTKPGWQPEVIDRVPEFITPYLRLVAHRPHVPQVYGSVALNRSGRRTSTLWLLEKAPIYSEGLGAALAGKVMPELSESWKTVGSMRQLNWLWQIANLWDAMAVEGVSRTLLHPEVLRVEGGLMRAIELMPNGDSPPKLAELGKLWKLWQKQARIGIAQALEKICDRLIKEDVTTATQLIALLDEALRTVGQKQFLNCNYITLTHTGPTREQNEDACYPPSSNGLYQKTGFELSLAIVCDGVGGHQGGEVASNLAIDTIQRRIENVLDKPENRYPDSIAIQIENSTCVANDQISLRNDSKNRQERERMGTTMVMSLIYGHEAYIAHIGDSRLYRITRTGCHQMTLDDDLATREVRLSGVLYRQALGMSSSGSLFQALGMNSSTALHPNIRRTIVDEECIFLLCSDGVSDRDRVEQYWQSEILPVLEGKVDLATACQRTINMANTQNGHDNATVALVHCQVKQPVEAGQNTAIQDFPANATTTFTQTDTLLLSSPETNSKDRQRTMTTQAEVPDSPRRQPLLLGAIGAIVLMAIGAGGWFLSQGQPNSTPAASPSPAIAPSPAVTPIEPGVQ
ncbi:protein phosphatase 2C domain-containing protein [Chamaesiphon sp. OTE_20_metabat_361]|uniref:protein phosphatase 2C domain-containing protein n=1 Tax=Chamaesiphon sp. OTE_20_metabat_361 TaxID=2964689 RepID=UPI00286A2959|nr:protein phosphatase 2C domain-containing protein [Chamaesiphon sp. OTE_20_metabat_361]